MCKRLQIEKLTNNCKMQIWNLIRLQLFHSLNQWNQIRLQLFHSWNQHVFPPSVKFATLDSLLCSKTEKWFTHYPHSFPSTCQSPQALSAEPYASHWNQPQHCPFSWRSTPSMHGQAYCPASPRLTPGPQRCDGTPDRHCTPRAAASGAARLHPWQQPEGWPREGTFRPPRHDSSVGPPHNREERHQKIINQSHK